MPCSDQKPTSCRRRGYRSGCSPCIATPTTKARRQVGKHHTPKESGTHDQGKHDMSPAHIHPRQPHLTYVLPSEALYTLTQPKPKIYAAIAASVYILPTRRRQQSMGPQMQVGNRSLASHLPTGCGKHTCECQTIS